MFMNRKRVLFAAKLLFSFGILSWVYWKLIAAAGVQALWERLANLTWGWLLFGYAMQLVAMSCSILRWQRLLTGQGIHAPLRHLFGSFMIGRFFGEFAPGGWTGLNGYRIYDIAKHTGKVARASAAIGIEMVLGWLSFGAVVLGGSLYGVRFLGVSGVLLVDAFFVGLIGLALLLISKPVLFRALTQRLGGSIAAKLRTTTDAVCAYEGKTWLVVQAVLLGLGTHTFRAFIYVAAARALAAELSVGEVFFGSALQVFATLLPASVNGIGLREATAVAVYTRGGVPESTAVLIPTLGFLLEISLSSLGGLVFLLRRVDYRPSISVEDADREDYAAHTASVVRALPVAPEHLRPRPLRGALLGASAGLIAGAGVGLGEAALVLAGSAAQRDYGALLYATGAYALIAGALGAGLGFASAGAGRLIGRAALPESIAYARAVAALFAGLSLAIGAFRLRRDYFHEVLRWKSALGLLVLAGCLAAALVLYALLARSLRLALGRRVTLARLSLPRTLLGAAAALLLPLMAARIGPPELPQRELGARPAAGPEAGHILFIVVDTLRADHLPSYGYRAGSTPALDRFAQDAIRFEAAFANASWTRPSFASILSGRFAASHRTMNKSDALPDEVVTLPEALRSGGYHTLGVVTNYNIAPFFNFDQGFDRYEYLQPNFVLGANDTAAKLLLVQSLRQAIETVRAKRGRVEVGTAYQDAATVNRAIIRLMEQPYEPATAPLFVFASYMDPHDPYYPHPYDGTAYSRAAHPRPKPEEVPQLIRLYDGEISFWDEHFGALMDHLRARGLYDDLTIVVTSDHGEEFFDHGGFWHGTTLYDELLRVPLFMKLPQNHLRGRVVRHFVQSIDIMPTLLKQAGLPVPEGVQGQDLFSNHDSVFAEESHEGNVLSALRQMRAGTALKLIRANPGNPRRLPPVELFQLDRDALEQVNVAGEEPELLRVTDASLRDQAEAAAQGRAVQRGVDVAADDSGIERLRALGYAGADKAH